MIEMEPVFQDAYTEMHVLDVEAGDGVTCHHIVHDGMQGVFRVEIDGEVHLGGDVEVIDIEEASLRTIVILTGLMVVGSEVHLIEVEVMDGFLTLILDGADGEGGGDGALLLHEAPLAFEVLQLAAGFTEPGVFVLRTLEAYLIGVIEGELDVLDRHEVDGEGHRRLLGGILLLRLRLLLLGVFLEGVDQELIVGRTVLGFVEAGLHTVEQHFLDLELPADQLQEVNIHEQAPQLEHLTVLLVFYLQAFETDLLGKHFYTGMADFYTRA